MTKAKIPPFDKLPSTLLRDSERSRTVRVVSEVEPPKVGKLLILMILLLVSIPDTVSLSNCAFGESVDTAWVRRYNGPGNVDDCASAVAVDNSGNVYVTGYSYGGSGIGDDYATIKYLPNGDTAWVKRYNGLGNGDDHAHAIAIDGFGNVCVTGGSAQTHGYIFSDYDYTTIKYYPNGDTVWVRKYNAGANSNNYVNTIAVDDSGNIYVTGSGWDSVTAYDYVTIKYFPNGDTAWIRRYNGPANDNDYAHDIAVDYYGNVYVTGTSWDIGTYPDYATIKYDLDGDTVWVRRYNGPGNDWDGANAIAIDNSGNIYVTGESYGMGTIGDYATIKYYPNGDTVWVRRYNEPGNNTDEAHDIIVDGSGNVYVSGASDYDFATIKYYPNGDTAWVRKYNGPANNTDGAYAIALDSSGNVYVTGYSFGGSGIGDDYATIKYLPNGDTAWVRRYNGFGNGDDHAHAIAIDGFGNVCVTGKSAQTHGYIFSDYDYTTIKYYPNGDTVWVRKYNAGANSNDYVNSIAVDDSGNVYVTGSGWDSVTAYDYVTIKYFPNGDTAWIRRYNGPANDNDYANAIAVDDYGNVYVTGTSWDIGTYPDYATIKYDLDGDTVWVRRYNGPGNDWDGANAIAIDNSGNIYVTGESYGMGTVSDYATIKYYPNGDTVWVRRYNEPGNNTDEAHDIIVDGSGNVYVSGASDYDFATIKYYPNGDTAWVRKYNGPANNTDGAYAIALDSSGNVYVTGWSFGSGSSWDYATIKYYPNGDTAWVRRYDGPGNWDDFAHAIAIDSSGNVYVTGESYGSGTNYDYCTMKYVQSPSDVKDETADKEKPSEFALSQNYPNPFNQSTKIEFTLAHSGFVSLNIYDILGRKVRTLVYEHLFSGYKSVLWDGENDSGTEVASGIYFYRLKTKDFTETKKLVLLK